MDVLESDFQILRMTDLFYNDFPNPPNIEILKKKQRAYNCLLFQTHYDFFICIPYRTEITHSFSYHFTSTKRAQKHKSGLDYTKILIINKSSYIDSQEAIIDKDEYIETIKNINKIKKEAFNYVEDYIMCIQGQKTIHEKEFSRRYGYSTLKYFHKELGIL